MADTLKIKRGLAANLPTLAVGEFGFTTDTKKLYIGTSGGNECINPEVATSILMTGYTKASTVAAILATDSASVAIGKLEKTTDGIQTLLEAI